MNQKKMTNKLDDLQGLLYLYMEQLEYCNNILDELLEEKNENQEEESAMDRATEGAH